MKNNMDIQIRFVPIADVEYNIGQIPGVPENPRTREDIKQRNLEKSIEDLPEMTIARPVLAYPFNGKYVVIGGNRRLEAQRALKRTEIPVVTLPEETSADKLRRIVMLDNESTGQTDWAMLARDWNKDEIRSWGIAAPKGWFNEPPAKNAEEDDFSEYKPVRERVKRGDIWLLGEHRLMCGDSADADDVKKLMGGVWLTWYLPILHMGCPSATRTACSTASRRLEDVRITSRMTRCHRSSFILSL